MAPAFTNIEGKRVFIAILDWGLGHASRCVPMVQALTKQGCEVYIICSRTIIDFLKKECPQAQYLLAPAYAIRYPTSSMVWNMASQAGRISKVMLEEYRLLKQWVEALQPDLIISDGRFACYHKKVKSIWMAHQLQIQHQNKWLARLLNLAYHRFIQKNYQAVWVPDYSGSQSIAGQLSKPIAKLKHTYLGPLSRFAQAKQLKKEKRYSYVALLSGPEPQRTYLEQELIEKLKHQKQDCLIIRGVKGSTELQVLSEHLYIVDQLYGQLLQAQIEQAQQIICRSGYSTLMDLHYWQIPAILIPTPGQTEQIYLAHLWQQKGWSQMQRQAQLDLNL